MIAWLAAAALAGDAACTTELPRVPDSLSVAWVSPLGARVGASGVISVVATSDLRRWIEAEHPAVGRLLQHLGLRKRDTAPRRAWKVTIFDVASSELCRPLPGYEGPGSAEGVPTCDRHLGVSGAYDGCGRLIDRADSSASLPVFHVSWADAARDGFCVLPLERFL